MQAYSPHTHGDHIHWSERVRFDLHDRARDICGFLSIGIWPNMRLKEVVCYLILPDGSILALKDHVPMDATTLSAKGLRFDVLDPGRAWKIAFQGGMERTMERKAKKSHVEISLRFDAVNDEFEHIPPDRPRNGGQPLVDSPVRVEQFGRLKGVLSTGLDEFGIDALGGMVRTWGVTDPEALRSSMALACQFSDSHGLSLYRRVSGEGSSDTGFVFQDGRNIPVTGTVLNVNFDFDRSPKSFDMALQDGEGNTHKVFGSIVKKVKVHFKNNEGELTAVANETLARFTVAGKNGYGIAEFLSRTE